MKKYVFLLIMFLLLIPTFVLAAVTFDAETNVTLSGSSINLTISSGSTANEVTVNSTDLTIVLAGGQSITINSSEKRMFSLSGRTYTEETQSYTTNSSSITLTLVSGLSTETLTVTPLDSYFTSGGGSSPTPVSTPASASAPAPTPVVTVTEEPVTAAPAKTAWEIQLDNIYSESAALRASKAEILVNVGKTEDVVAEQAAETKYIVPLVSSAGGGAGVSVTSESRGRMVNFVNYGTETTLRLGAGERAGVLYCFEDVYDKLPTTQDDWDDVIKIGNGRWPKQTVPVKEAEAEKIFKKIYLREPDRTNPHDDAAVVIITYGLKPVHRSLVNERAALKTFDYIYGRLPSSNMDWKMVRAIAESGATR